MPSTRTPRSGFLRSRVSRFNWVLLLLILESLVQDVASILPPQLAKMMTTWSKQFQESVKKMTSMASGEGGGGGGGAKAKSEDYENSGKGGGGSGDDDDSII